MFLLSERSGGDSHRSAERFLWWMQLVEKCAIKSWSFKEVFFFPFLFLPWKKGQKNRTRSIGWLLLCSGKNIFLTLIFKKVRTMKNYKKGKRRKAACLVCCISDDSQKHEPLLYCNDINLYASHVNYYYTVWLIYLIYSSSHQIYSSMIDQNI